LNHKPTLETAGHEERLRQCSEEILERDRRVKKPGIHFERLGTRAKYRTEGNAALRKLLALRAEVRPKAEISGTGTRKRVGGPQTDYKGAHGKKRGSS